MTETLTITCQQPAWTLTLTPTPEDPTRLRITGAIGLPETTRPGRKARAKSPFECYMTEVYPTYREQVTAQLRVELGVDCHSATELERRIRERMPPYLEMRRTLTLRWQALTDQQRSPYEALAMESHRQTYPTELDPVTVAAARLSMAAVAAYRSDWSGLLGLLPRGVEVPHTRLKQDDRALAIIRACGPVLAEMLSGLPGFHRQALEAGEEMWSRESWLEQANDLAEEMNLPYLCGYLMHDGVYCLPVSLVPESAPVEPEATPQPALELVLCRVRIEGGIRYEFCNYELTVRLGSDGGGLVDRVRTLEEGDTTRWSSPDLELRRLPDERGERRYEVQYRASGGELRFLLRD